MVYSNLIQKNRKKREKFCAVVVFVVVVVVLVVVAHAPIWQTRHIWRTRERKITENSQYLPKEAWNALARIHNQHSHSHFLNWSIIIWRFCDCIICIRHMHLQWTSWILDWGGIIGRSGRRRFLFKSHGVGECGVGDTWFGYGRSVEVRCRE